MFEITIESNNRSGSEKKKGGQTTSGVAYEQGRLLITKGVGLLSVLVLTEVRDDQRP